MERMGRNLDDLQVCCDPLLCSCLQRVQGQCYDGGGFSDQFIKMLGVSCSDAAPPTDYTIGKNGGYKPLVEQPQ